MNSDWTRPFEPDEHTVVLYHFDEGEGDQAHDACGDPELTLRAYKKALWGRRPGFGSTARFDRQNAPLLVGPANNDKLELRPRVDHRILGAIHGSWREGPRPELAPRQGIYPRLHLRNRRGRMCVGRWVSPRLVTLPAPDKDRGSAVDPRGRAHTRSQIHRIAPRQGPKPHDTSTLRITLPCLPVSRLIALIDCFIFSRRTISLSSIVDDLLAI